ncbi:MAG TPA: hypothetical protein VIN72_14050 [Lutibacter sp.]
MKIRILILLIFYFVLSSCTNLKYINKFDGHNGKPKIIESKSYSVVKKNDSILKGEQMLHHIDYYDIIGRHLKIFSFRPNGTKSMGGLYYEYDRFGHLSQVTFYNKDSTVNSQTNFIYNKKGQKLSEEHIRENNEQKSIYFSEYLEKRNITKVFGKKSDGTIIEKILMQHNKKGEEIEKLSFNENNTLKSKITFRYDNKGNLIEQIWYNSEGVPLNKYTKTYDKNNNYIYGEKYRLIGKDSLINTTKRQIEYDKKGNVLKYIFFENDKPTLIEEYKIIYWN